jgi:reactive intermediate/imine deaminase
MEPHVMKKGFGSGAPYPYTPAVRAGDFVFISGQVPISADGTLVKGGVEAQTRAVLDNLGQALALAGCGFDDVVKVTAFLGEAGDFEAFNAVYATYFKVPLPARSTVCISLVIDARIELEAIAYRPLAAGGSA